MIVTSSYRMEVPSSSVNFHCMSDEVGRRGLVEMDSVDDKFCQCAGYDRICFSEEGSIIVMTDIRAVIGLRKRVVTD